MMKTQIERNNILEDLICYCFGYSADDIQKDFLNNGKSTIMEKIQMEKKMGIVSVQRKIQKENDA